ncbi:hypothetical protein [Niabella ginsengisoli]|uniref:Uncharacterized protein n=1 Tax=Niabella ginsengisoli TaxID=522298 RepID=A0ABS9SR13_9BACT|nr:hypothetical protein [Niabella ginsengisoli]MCH5600811.1 hypothetical protein [Niabella ginsengisoli]
MERVLKYGNKVWRTVKFASLDGKNNLLVKSHEFTILPINSNNVLSISDFEAINQPKTYHKYDTSFCEIIYKPSREAEKIWLVRKTHHYLFCCKGSIVYQEKINLKYKKSASVDRLEVE